MSHCCRPRRERSSQRPIRCGLFEAPATAFQLAQLLEQSALLAAQALRNMDPHRDVEITALRATEGRKPLAAQAQNLAGLCAPRNAYTKTDFERRNVDLRAEHCVADLDRLRAPEVGAVAREARIGGGTEHNEKIARLAARHGRRHAAALYAQHHPVLRPDGHVDAKLRRDLRLSRSAAARARRIDDPAASAAGRARCDLSERDAALALGD